MPNPTPPARSSSRLIQLVLFLGSLSVVVMYLVRRKAVQPPLEAPLLSLPITPVPTEKSISAVVDQSAAESIQPSKPIKSAYQLTALLLTFVFGFALIILKNIDPQLASASVAVIAVISLGILVWNPPLVHIVFLRFLYDLITLPMRFYGEGRSITEPAAQAASWIASWIFLGGGVIALFLSSAQPLLALGIILALMLMATYAWLTSLDVLIVERRFLTALSAIPAPDAVALPRLTWWLLLAEMFIILLTTLFTTRPFYQSPANWQFSGNEGEWLTSTIYAASSGLKEYGRIPRWQPYVGHGEPTIENPFNFIFNPVTSVPSFLFGPSRGLRLSVILSYFLAGLGGWFLARMLGLGVLGRVLLAMILMGKGNIHAMLNSSYFQLALSQIYMPWVIGGVIAVVRFPQRRWPVVLTALAMTLQLFTGNLWYVLPTAVGALLTALVCVFGLQKRQINRPALRRYITVAVMTIGLSAIIALPVLLQFNRVGRHTEEIQAGWVTPLSDIVPLFFDPARDRSVTFFEPVRGRESFHYIYEVDEFYYSYIIPGWYVLLIFVALPLYRPLSRRNRMIGLLAVALFALAILWGAGGQQPMLWFYEHVTPLRQWRFVPRALAVAGFWLTIIVAMRADHLWTYIRTADWARFFSFKLYIHQKHVIAIILGAILVVATGYAAADVNDQWNKYETIVQPIGEIRDTCVRWLRHQYPDAQLSVWQQNYTDILTFLNNRVRSWNITADFEMLPQMPTFSHQWLDLVAVLPQFAAFDNPNQRAWGHDNHYVAISNSPKLGDGEPCLYRHVEPTLPYAYSISLQDLDAIQQPYYVYEPDVSAFAPIRLVERRVDQVALIMTTPRPTPVVVGLQESAYPGWRVEVDGQPAKIESVGRNIGVVIPAGDKLVQVYFVYDPIQPVIGGLITLVTAFVCILYLLTSRLQGSRLLGSAEEIPPAV